MKCKKIKVKSICSERILYLKDYINELIQLQKQIKKRCQHQINNEYDISIQYCLECKEYYCNKCLKYHQRQHSLFPCMCELEVICEMDEEKDICYCFNCEKPFCENCYNSNDHSLHNTISLQVLKEIVNSSTIRMCLLNLYVMKKRLKTMNTKLIINFIVILCNTSNKFKHIQHFANLINFLNYSKFILLPE